jgi:hypothetical protein
MESRFDLQILFVQVNNSEGRTKTVKDTDTSR